MNNENFSINIEDAINSIIVPIGTSVQKNSCASPNHRERKIADLPAETLRHFNDILTDIKDRCVKCVILL